MRLLSHVYGIPPSKTCASIAPACVEVFIHTCTFTHIYEHTHIYIHSTHIKTHGSESQGQGGSTWRQAGKLHVNILQEQTSLKLKMT